MSETAAALAAANWDREYAENGRYSGEPPIPFVETILAQLGEEHRQGYGLYVGCGNGRNYLPLVDAGLKLHGNDISPAAIEQLRSRRPEIEGMTFVTDFGHYDGVGIFNYLVAIQSFQHGNRKAVYNLFHHAHQALKTRGLLFLRVNSISTDIVYRHEVTEATSTRGRTIRYLEGPKAGQEIHFFGRQELGYLAAKHAFTIIQEPREVVEHRQPPHEGTTWTQWETIWQKGAQL